MKLKEVNKKTLRVDNDSKHLTTSRIINSQQAQCITERQKPCLKCHFDRRKRKKYVYYIWKLTHESINRSVF